MSIKNALVVDDSELSGLYMKNAFVALGYEVAFADTAEKAVELTQKIFFDIITMDYHMPNINGVDCIRLIKAYSKFVKQPFIIAVTADQTFESRLALVESGVDGFLAKPVTVESLHSYIQNLRAA